MIRSCCQMRDGKRKCIELHGDSKDREAIKRFNAECIKNGGRPSTQNPNPDSKELPAAPPAPPAAGNGPMRCM